MTAHFTAIVLDENDADDRAELARLRHDPTIEFLDRLAEQRDGLARLTPPPPQDILDEPMRWVHYPWRRTVVATLGPVGFRRLRLDRNRNKITAEEQDRLSTLKIGIVGLSVGHAIAYALALDGVCGTLRLADFDEIELSNLNRIPATLLDLGVTKPIVAARRIAELDPYLPIEIDERGVTAESADSFVDGLDLVIEECDSLDVKLLVREHARAHGVPVIMETSDRGLLDVERFDLEPNRALFHGLLGDIQSSTLRGLSTHDKVPYVLALLGADDLSARMAASMIEVDRTTTTWPQLGSEVTLGGASVAGAVRRFGLGQKLESGRVRIHIDEHLDGLVPPTGEIHIGGVVPIATSEDDTPAEVDALRAIADAATRAPSGGNVQPWHITVDDVSVGLSVDRERTSGLDVAYRGSHVALGAALFNARVAAADRGVLGETKVDTVGETAEVTLMLGDGADPALASRYPRVLARVTNRNLGSPSTVDDTTASALSAAAESEGTRLSLITDRAAIEQVAEIIAESDRIRYLTNSLHSEMISELRWPGQADPNTGIDVHALALDPTDLVKLDVSRRSDVMALLRDWDAGVALGEDSYDRIMSSSGLAVTIVSGDSPADFVRGGSGTQNVWITAEEHGLAVHPASPVFIYAHKPAEFDELSSHYARALTELKQRFDAVAGVEPGESITLVLRLSHTDAEAVKSRRRSRTDVSSQQVESGAITLN
ncbi:Rv1355c family protein [Rhodococcoides kyotonense]|uniref:ThiF family protein n=1 Tax=Rhodococcoides kyotonense TaxID=398843 RepID=A0A239J826_9NOCA|nr:Rv1355c family protein [Rhodococcus kyotonensis]SNT01955.1 ThiF family protein [Rhodococcus kyotonensis]